MIWSRFIGLSALALLVACSNDEKGVAAGSLETENSIAFHVKLANGQNASKAYVIIHESEYFADKVNLDSTRHPQTDENGILELDSLPRGNYIVEVRSLQDKQEQKGATTFEITQVDNDSGKVVTVQTGVPASFEGKAYTDKYPAWVIIRGLEYKVPVDSQGNFSFESLPEGVFEFVLVHSQTNSAGATVSQILTEEEICVGCNDSEPVNLVDKTAPPKDSVSKDTATADTVAADTADTDTIPKDTLKHFVFDDFENSVSAWYESHSEKASGSLEISEAGEGRNGLAAHFQCTNDADYNWALMGQYLGGHVDMSALDSVVFWARGSVKKYISFSFDIVTADSKANITSIKSWIHIVLAEQWTRYSFTPTDMVEAEDDNGGNVGWDAVKDGVTNISIFGGAGGEFWIDDIEFFGLDKFTPKSE